ncbi:MAG: hypothetical protein M3324_05000, partial [Actinomycetota bacterium]|nr:hypothetical protein [Actinomycetota bacterium]
HQLPLVAPGIMTFREPFIRIRYYTSGGSTGSRGGSRGVALGPRPLEGQAEDFCDPAQEASFGGGVYAGNVQRGDTTSVDDYTALVGAQPRIVNVFQAWRWTD